MKKVLLIYFALLLTLSSLLTMPMTVSANDDADDSNETPDLEMTETQPAEEMNVTREAVTIDIFVEVIWVHGENVGALPTSVDLYLYDEAGIEVAVVTVDESDGWEYTFTDLEQGDYTVREAAIDNYDIFYDKNDAGHFVIRNTYLPAAAPVEPETINIPVEIIWEHGFNEGTYPASVDLYLYDETGTEVSMVTVTESDGWAYTFTDLSPQDYTVREAAIDNYDIVYARDESGNFTVTNTYLPAEPQTMDIPVQVVWVHGENTGALPTSVDLYLYDGAGVLVDTVTVNASDEWYYVFTDLEPGDYTVWEAAIEDYVATYARDEAGKITITNTYFTEAPETMDIPVEVIWVHGDNKGPFPTSVDIYLYDEAGVEVERITIDGAEGWQVTFINLEPGDYTVREAAITNYDIAYAKDEAGNFTITNTYIPVKKPVEPSKPEAPTKPGEPTQPENPTAELPATGIAVSNTILIVAGVLLAVGAALFLFTRRRNTVK